MRRRRRPIAVAAVLSAAVAMATVSGPAGAAEAGPSFVLHEGSTELPAMYKSSAAISDDKLFTISAEAVEYHPDRSRPILRGGLYERSLTSDDDSVVLGDAVRIARSSGLAMAHHEGSLAYLRSIDGRLVIRDRQGKESVPSWGNDVGLVRSGPEQMNRDWVETEGVLYRLADGHRLDLTQHSQLPAIYALEVRLGEQHVLWTAVGDNGDGTYWDGVYLAELTSTGIQNPRLLRGNAGSLVGIGSERALIAHSANVSDPRWRISSVTYENFDLETGARGADIVIDVGRETAYQEASGFLAGNDLVTVFAIDINSALQNGAPSVTRLLRQDVLSGAETGRGELDGWARGLDVAWPLAVYVDINDHMLLRDFDDRPIVEGSPSEPEPPGSFVTQVPARAVSDPAVVPGAVQCVKVAGDAVPEDATGVVVNVTSVRPQGLGYAVVYPDTAGDGRTPMPARGSTVNFERDKDVANTAFVAVPDSGQICYAVAGARAGVLLDVAGYTRAGSGVVTHEPVRVLDTRPGAEQEGAVVGPVQPGRTHTVDVATKAGVPASAQAVLVNVTVTGTTHLGNLRVFPAGVATPQTSTVNYAPGKDKATGTIVKLGKDQKVSFLSESAGPVQVVMDVVGYVEAGSAFVGLTPTRVMDTRPGTDHLGPVVGPISGRPVVSLPLQTDGEVPEDATGVVLNVTAVAPTALGHLRVYPDTDGTGRTPPPDASWLNYITGDRQISSRAIPNMVIAELPENGQVNFYSDTSGQVHLVADLIGYITD